MPRASTSVATSTSHSPARNALSARSRWAWLRSPWIAAQVMPARAKRRLQASARCLVRQNTMARKAPSRLSTLASSAFLASSETGSTYCSTVSAVEVTGAISTRAGSCTRSVMEPTACSSRVAENSRV